VIIHRDKTGVTQARCAEKQKHAKRALWLFEAMLHGMFTGNDRLTHGQTAVKWDCCSHDIESTMSASKLQLQSNLFNEV
jgi:hypothetical protein